MSQPGTPHPIPRHTKEAMKNITAHPTEMPEESATPESIEAAR